jgi:hypothetical protein
MSRIITVQEFSLEITGNGIFEVNTTSNQCMVPFFGFGPDGKVLSRKQEKEYVPIKQEWIDELIKYQVDAIDKIKKESLDMYISIIRRSDKVNEIAVMVDFEQMSINDSSVFVKNIKRHEIEDKVNA